MTFGGSLVRSARFGDCRHDFWRTLCTKRLYRKTVWRNYVCDVVLPLGFARPGWEVRLRGAAGERETCWCKRGVSLVSGMSGSIMWPSRRGVLREVHVSETERFM